MAAVAAVAARAGGVRAEPWAGVKVVAETVMAGVAGEAGGVRAEQWAGVAHGVGCEGVEGHTEEGAAGED